MNTLASLFSDILTALCAGLRRHAPPASEPGASEPGAKLHAVHNHIRRMAHRLESLFARFQAGTLPSQTGAAPRPSRAGQSRARHTKPDQPAPARLRYPTSRMWLLKLAQPPAANAASHLQLWLAHPEFQPFLAAAPQAGRILRPLCRMLGIEAQPSAPAELNLPKPPKFRPAPPPPPIYLGIIDPPEVQPYHLGLPRNRAGRAWYQ